MTTAPAPVPATLPKPQTFRQWYRGDILAPEAGREWVSDARLAVRLDAVRLKAARSLLLKPCRLLDVQRNVPGGDKRIRDFVASAARDTWTSLPRLVGTFNTVETVSLPRTRPGARLRWQEIARRYAVVLSDVEHGAVPLIFEGSAVEWMLANVRAASMRIDPVRGTMFLTVDGTVVALLMGITFPVDNKARLAQQVRDFVAARAVVG